MPSGALADAAPAGHNVAQSAFRFRTVQLEFVWFLGTLEVRVRSATLPCDLRRERQVMGVSLEAALRGPADEVAAARQRDTWLARACCASAACGPARSRPRAELVAGAEMARPGVEQGATPLPVPAPAVPWAAPPPRVMLLVPPTERQGPKT
jgi:hypothetical protein